MVSIATGTIQTPTARSLASFTKLAGRTSNIESILKSPNSGNSIRSLFCAKKPAATIPNNPPRKKINPLRLLRDLGAFSVMIFETGARRTSSALAGHSCLFWGLDSGAPRMRWRREAILREGGGGYLQRRDGG